MPRDYRFFVTEPWINEVIALPAPIVHQILHVLRLKAGDQVILFDGSGQEYVTALFSDSGTLKAHRVETRTGNTTPHVEVHLYQGLLKARKLELVLQKCTELGVAAFIPMACERSVSEELSRQKFQRFHTIIREAAEQSGGTLLPSVKPMEAYRDSVESVKRGIVLHPAGRERLREALDHGCDATAQSIALFVGPEGGFTNSEIDLAEQAGIVSATVGRRILRAETAAIVASAIALDYFESVPRA